MIDPWSLPGPAAFLRRVAEDLTDGRQVVLYGLPPPGLRQALEGALAPNQMTLRVVYDDPGLGAEAVFDREADGTGAGGTLRAGAWWIDGVAPDRGAQWLTVVGQMAARARPDPPARRALLVVPVQGPKMANGLDIAAHRAEPLGRVDLEVAARYAAAARGPVGLTDRVQIDLAVEMASGLLPRTEALRALAHWMEAPCAVLKHPGRLAEHAEATQTVVPLPEYRLWRAQQMVLLDQIEELRLGIVRSGDIKWIVPYTAVVEGRTPKTITHVEQLELTHLCA